MATRLGYDVGGILARWLVEDLRQLERDQAVMTTGVDLGPYVDQILDLEAELAECYRVLQLIERECERPERVLALAHERLKHAPGISRPYGPRYELLREARSAPEEAPRGTTER